MPSNRENIQAALLTRLQTIPDFIKTTRYYIDFAKLAQTQQPALSVIAVSATAAREPGQPAKWTQHAMVVIYVRTPSESAATPETELFTLIEKVETALQRQPSELGSMTDDYGTTLGGLVWKCHIIDMRIHHGLGESQAAASLTVEMLSLS